MKLVSAIRQTLGGWIQGKAASVPPTLGRIVTPSARDRWMSKRAQSFTPDQIASTLQGAFNGNLVAQWELFDLMEDTWPRLVKDLNELKNAVLSLEWTLQAWAPEGADPSTEAEKRKAFISSVLWQMRPKPEADENDFESTIRDVLDAWAKGISVLEIDWTVGTATVAGAPGSAVIPRCTTWVHPRYYGYPLTGTSLMLNAAEIAQSAASFSASSASTGFRLQGADWFPFPENKFLIGIAKQKTGHPIGAALLRPLAFWWCAANFTSEWFLNFAQIFGMPIRWATYDPARKDLLDQIADMLQNMGSAGWGAFPAGTVLELKEASKTAGENPQAYLLNFADKQADLLILGQTLTTDVGDSGSRALGDVHFSVRGDIIEAAGNWAAKVINGQLIPAICRLNYGNDAECPWFMPALKESKDAKEMAERDQILLTAGVEMPKQWFYDRHDIPLPANGEEVIVSAPPPAAPLPGQRPTNARAIQAKDATEQLLDRVLEDLTGVQARWLGGVKPYFRGLILAAQNDQLTDEQFVRVLETAQGHFPELFQQLDHKALADAIEASLGSAVVNGLVQGALKRKVRPALPEVTA